MSEAIWLVLDETGCVRLKTTDADEANLLAITKQWHAMRYEPGSTVSVLVCKKCRTHLQDRKCPTCEAAA